MKVSFGIHLAPGLFLRRAELARAADLVKMAEDYGAEAIGTYDSAFIGDDAFVRASQMALASTRAKIGCGANIRAISSTGRPRALGPASGGDDSSAGGIRRPPYRHPLAAGRATPRTP